MSAKTQLWLVRHAETAKPTVFHGAESDVELGEHGKKQALAAADWYRDQVRPTVILSSTMTRAIQTARICADAIGVEPRTVLNLHERRVGALGGVPYQADGPWPETVRRWMAGEVHFTTPGAETYQELVDRCVPALHEAIRPYAGERILLITHGIVVKILLLSLLNNRTSADWEKIGHILNMITSEISWDGESWQEAQLMYLPPPVIALNELRK
jgi:2,3-bisphosphoglycerate-dependent phosphoglycerate mutase